MSMQPIPGRFTDVAAIRKMFLVSAIIILAITAVLKLFALVDNEPFLRLTDPLFTFAKTRQIISLACGFELFVVGYALLAKCPRKALGLVACLATLFGAYRLGLVLIYYHKPCQCLGGVLQWAGLSSEHVDRLSLTLLLYMFAGSYGLLIRDRIINRS